MKKIGVSSSFIEDLLLCDPITERGREKLRNLGIIGKIGPKQFFEKKYGIWVPPIEAENAKAIAYEIDPSDSAPYKERQVEYEAIARRRVEFNKLFSGEPGSHFAALMGVVGSGKSVEVQRKVYENTEFRALPYRVGDQDWEIDSDLFQTPNAILIDLERDVRDVQDGVRYSCPRPLTPMWLFCTSLLETVRGYILYLKRTENERLKNAIKNLELYFENDALDIHKADEYRDLFVTLAYYASGEKREGKSVTSSNVFRDILNILKSNPDSRSRDIFADDDAAGEDIERLLILLFLLQFCTFPTTPKNIIIDNIEEYIGIRFGNKTSKSIAVSNVQVKKIYDCLETVARRIQTTFIDDAIKKVRRESKTSVSIIMCIRRTTFELLNYTYMGTVESKYDEVFDITGDIDISDIWDAKKRALWDNETGIWEPGEQNLQNSCESSMGDYIAFADIAFRDSKDINSLQERYSRMLARGLRRIGHCESQAIFDLYRLLVASPDVKQRKYISYKEFLDIQASDIGKVNAAKHLFRMAFLEQYYRRQFLSMLAENEHSVEESRNFSRNRLSVRWKNLNIGYLSAEKTGTLYASRHPKEKVDPEGKDSFKYNSVKYVDNNQTKKWRSLLHRLLCILEKGESDAVSRCIAPTYTPISLFDLMDSLWKDVKTKPTEEDFNHLSDVLLSASQPERYGDFAPFVLMRIEQDPENEIIAYNKKYAVLLKDIWEAGSSQSVEGEKYDWKHFGVRLSEAGKEFLHIWQPSFSFFSALYCSNHAPLYFIKSPVLAIHIINKVCSYARLVRDSYCDEAKLFLDSINSTDINALKKSDQLVTKKGDTRWTYRRQIRELHMSFLTLYSSYINSCYSLLGMSEADKDKIVKAVEKAIWRYGDKLWKDISEVQQKDSNKDTKGQEENEQAIEQNWQPAPCF